MLLLQVLVSVAVSQLTILLVTLLYTIACNLTCPAGYIPNSNCSQCVFSDICERDMPCQNGGICMLVSAPDNYTCNCTGTRYVGVNCTGMLLTFWLVKLCMLCQFCCHYINCPDYTSPTRPHSFTL